MSEITQRTKCCDLCKGWKKFPDSEQGEEKDEFIEMRNAVSTSGRLPDDQGEPSAHGNWLFIFIARG